MFFFLLKKVARKKLRKAIKSWLFPFVTNFFKKHMSTATLVPSGEITGKITEPHSWKELLNKYQNEKSTLGFEMPLVARVTREHSDVWRNKQREVDPVTQKFRDHVREQKTEDAEARERTQQLKRAFVRINNASIKNLGKIGRGTRCEYFDVGTKT